MSIPTITHDDNKTYALPTIFHNIEQESGSKSRIRALTRDPTRPGPKLLTRWPGSISDMQQKRKPHKTGRQATYQRADGMTTKKKQW